MREERVREERVREETDRRERMREERDREKRRKHAKCNVYRLKDMDLTSRVQLLNEAV